MSATPSVAFYIHVSFAHERGVTHYLTHLLPSPPYFKITVTVLSVRAALAGVGFAYVGG